MLGRIKALKVLVVLHLQIVVNLVLQWYLLMQFKDLDA